MRGGWAVVGRYAEEMQAGLWDFTKSSAPITAFHDGENYWLGDGFHRVAAAKKARLDEIEVDVRQGGQREAILYSVGANATHGYPRSNEDKRRAVSRLLEDPEWSKWSDREIARHCSVTHPYVSKLRASLETVTSERRTYTTKHGTVATMDTRAIGKPPAPPAAQLEVGRAETDQAGSDNVADIGEAAQAVDDAKPTAKPLETENWLKRYLSRNDFSSLVRHPARRVAVAARMSTPQTTLMKARQSGGAWIELMIEVADRRRRWNDWTY